jgi:hypothetical protein
MRRILLAVFILSLLIGVAVAQETRILVDPVEGPIGTTHAFLVQGLDAGTAYRLDVVYREDEAVVFSGGYTADADGNLMGALVSEPSDIPGAYDLRLYDSDGQLVASGELIIVGGAPGAHSTGDFAFGVPVNGTLASAFDIYTFTAEAGDVVNISLKSSQFDAYLELYDTSTTLIARNNDGGGGTDALIRAFPLAVSGQYSVKVTSVDGQQGGAYTLLVNKARPASGGVIGAGETVVGTIAAGDPTPEYTFTGTAGDIVRIELNSTDFDPLVRLINPNGSQLAANDDALGQDSLLDRIVLPESGTYTVIVDGFRGVTGRREISGGFALTLDFLSGGAAAQPPQGEPAEPQQAQTPSGTPITYGETLTGAFNADVQNATFTFDGRTGDVVTIAVDSPDFDAQLYLLDPSGLEIAFDDDSGADLNPLIAEFSLPSDGTYVIIVDGYRGVNGNRLLEGEFNLNLSSSSARPAEPVEPIEATPTPTPTPTPLPPPSPTPTPEPAQSTAVPPVSTQPATPTPLPTMPLATFAPEDTTLALGETVSGIAAGDDMVYTFDGTTGELVTIRLEAQAFDPLLLLIAPDGTEIMRDDDSGGGLNAAILNYVLPQTGTYQIIVTSYAGENDRRPDGEYILSLEQGFAPVTATPEMPAPTETPADAVLPPLPEGLEPFSITYGLNTAALFSGQPDEAFAYTFSALRGDVVTLRATSSGTIDTALYLVEAATGAVVAYDDDSGSGFDPEIANVTLGAGDYIAYLLPELAQTSGSVTLRVSLVSPLDVVSGQPVTVRLTDALPRQEMRLRRVTEGDLISLSVVPQSVLTGEPLITVMQGREVIARNRVGLNLRLVLEFKALTNEPITISVEGEPGVLELIPTIR